MEIVRAPLSQSSNLVSIGFILNGRTMYIDGEDAPVPLCTMDVEFQRGALYRYHDVPVKVAAAITSSNQPGKLFDAAVKKAGFRYEKLVSARK